MWEPTLLISTASGSRMKGVTIDFKGPNTACTSYCWCGRRRYIWRIFEVGHSRTSFLRVVKTELLKDISSPLYDFTETEFRCVSRQEGKFHCHIVLAE